MVANANDVNGLTHPEREWHQPLNKLSRFLAVSQHLVKQKLQLEYITRHRPPYKLPILSAALLNLPLPLSLPRTRYLISCGAPALCLRSRTPSSNTCHVQIPSHWSVHSKCVSCYMILSVTPGQERLIRNPGSSSSPLVPLQQRLGLSGWWANRFQAPWTTSAKHSVSRWAGRESLPAVQQ
jgi:hypothetical protein